MRNIQQFERTGRDERKGRALKQRMYLLSASCNSVENWRFEIEGFSGTHYNVTFERSGMKCNCPFVKTRHRTCKHMFFVIGRICKLQLDRLDTDRYQINIFEKYPELHETLKDILYKRTKSETESESQPVPIEQNRIEMDDCVICFESMNDGSLKDCGTCKNNFHLECVSRWLKSKSSCPLCRGRMFNEKKKSRGPDIIVDAMSKMQIIEAVTVDEKIEIAVKHIKKTYGKFISKSENPRSPNINLEKLDKIIEKFMESRVGMDSIELVQELDRVARIVPPDNQSLDNKKVREKCERYNCYLFI
jgi:hypothetical protein